MCIILGKYKSRRINFFKGLFVRFIIDFVKEGFFNILNNRIFFFEINVLEFFVGIGNISFELVLRGVKEIIVVDLDFGCINFIKKILVELDMFI